MTPTLSLCVICGDKGVGTLARMVKSFLDRPGGPACDEIMLSWNGKDDVALVLALGEVVDGDAVAIPPGVGDRLDYRTRVGAIPLILHRQEWRDDFAAARNENFALASGEWRMYADTDDTLAAPDDPAVHESIAEEPTPPDARASPVPFVGTLPERLRRLPGHVNCVVAPYNYIVSDKRRPIIRKRRPRIVRWDPWWVWVSEVHEVLRHALDREVRVWDAGILLIHDPHVPIAERLERNFGILERRVAEVRTRGEEVPLALLHGLAAHAFDANDHATAAETYVEAAARAGDREERLLFYLYAGRAHIEMGRFRDAGQCAKDAIEAAPDRPEGYLAAAECAFRLRLYDYCIKWYEASEGKPIPPGAMLDDRVERCIRPAHHAAVAYLRLGRPDRAREVAAIALKETDDPFAVKVMAVAEEQLRRRRIAATLRTLTADLVESGYPGAALRAVGTLLPVLREEPDARASAVMAREALDRAEPKPLRPGSAAERWLLTAGESDNDVAIPVPLDSAEDPAAFIEAAAARTPDGAWLLACATDARDTAPTAVATRAEAVPAPWLLAELERHGDVQEVGLLEDEATSERHVVSRTRVHRGRAPWTPDVTFWCPTFAESWGPWRLVREGCGGSEESVIYLAREFARLGLRTQVFAPLDLGRHGGVHVEDDVRWWPLDAFDSTARVPGWVIAHRAPWAVRLPAFDPSRLYVWHQDHAYAMGWSRPVAEASRSLFVSKWQREALLHAVGIDVDDPHGLVDRYGIVCGDAIPESACVWTERDRDPAACAYLSSPIRGLHYLLGMWPRICADEPSAVLHLYYGWETLPTRGPIGTAREEIMRTAAKTPNVVWHGRVAQTELEQALPRMGVWLYPCIFPEGYCIAGVRAVAAGLVPVYRGVAALPETQFPSPFTLASGADSAWVEQDYPRFVDAAVAAIRASREGRFDREAARVWARARTWGHVASAIIADFERHGAAKRNVA